MTIIIGLPLVAVAQRTVTAAAQPSFGFDDLAALVPAGSKHLVVEVSGAQTFGSRRFCRVIVNADSTASYARREFDATGSTVSTRNATATDLAQGVDIPPAQANAFGGGYLIFPHAFRAGTTKLWHSMGSSLDERVQRHVGSWKKTDPIDSLTFRPWPNVAGPNEWVAGSTVTLHVVDEDQLVDEQILGATGTFGFAALPPGHDHLGLLMDLRSDQVLPTRQGDRVYQVINSDATASYRMQRLGAEHNATDRIIDGSYLEPRVGWSTAASAPAGSMANLVVLYPEFARSGIEKSWLSQHASYDGVWFPVSQENGRWTRTDPVTDLEFHPQQGTGFVAGSSIALYRLPGAGSRVVVGPAGAASVRLTVPSGLGSLRLLVLARSDAPRPDDRVLVELNDDATAAHYARRRVSALDSTHETAAASDNEFGVIPAATTAGITFGAGIVAFPAHTAGDRHQHILSAMGASGGRIGLYGGSWNDVAPVTSITLRPRYGSRFEADSVFEILG